MKRVLTAVAAAVLALGAASPAVAAPTGDYSVPWSNTEGFWHYHDGASTYYRSVAPGSPPAPGPNYVKYAWAPSVYAVSFFDTAPESSWGWRHLTFEEWQRAGAPTGQWNAGWIEGTELVKYSTSNEIIASLDEVSHKLTYAEWAATGFRTPTSKHEGYMKLTWDSSIAYMYEPDDGYRISYQDWVDAGFPTPEQRRMLPGDEVCSSPYTSTLFYSGASYTGTISYDQWRAAGFPQPTRC